MQRALKQMHTGHRTYESESDSWQFSNMENFQVLALLLHIPQCKNMINLAVTITNCCITTNKSSLATIIQVFMPDFSLSNECDIDQQFSKLGPQVPLGFFHYNSSVTQQQNVFWSSISVTDCNETSKSKIRISGGILGGKNHIKWEQSNFTQLRCHCREKV